MVLAIIQDLMVKAQDLFLDHFARLGIFSKVQALTGPNDVQENIEENEATNEQGNSLKISQRVSVLLHLIF